MSEIVKTWRRQLVKVEDDVWTKLKAQAAIEHRPLFAVVATALREYLKAAKGRPARSL